MKKIFFGLSLILVIGSVHATNFETARVKLVLEQKNENNLLHDLALPSQKLLVETADGQEFRIDPSQYQIVTDPQILKKGDPVVVATSDGTEPRIIDRFRLPSLGILLILFVVIAWFVGGKTTLRALLGLGISIAILGGGLFPALLHGAPALPACIFAAVGITGISITISHGWRRRTGLSVLSSFITLALAFGLATVVVLGTRLSGVSSEQTYYLVTGINSHFDLRGLLLGSIVLGVVGVLDDVTTTQIASVEEISLANPTLSRQELWQRGMSVGHEHIASMINTLALAYAGAALPMFLLAAMATAPLWTQLNSEFFATEIVRTVVGSTALLLGVPISNMIAAWHWQCQKSSPKK